MLVIHGCVEIYILYYRTFAIVNIALLPNLVRMSYSTLVQLQDIFLKLELWDQRVHTFILLIDIVQLLGYTNLYSHQQYTRNDSAFLQTLDNTVCVKNLGIFTNLISEKSQHSFNLHFSCDEHLLIDLRATLYSSLNELCLFICFAHFSIELLVFSLLICRSSLYIKEISPLSWVTEPSLPPHPAPACCLLTLLIVCFVMQKIWFCYMVEFINFFFMALGVCVTLRKAFLTTGSNFKYVESLHLLHSL